MSRLRQEFKIMWGNVWFRSLCELILIAAGFMIFLLILQATAGGRQVIEQVNQQLRATTPQ